MLWSVMPMSQRSFRMFRSNIAYVSPDNANDIVCNANVITAIRYVPQCDRQCLGYIQSVLPCNKEWMARLSQLCTCSR